VKPTAGGSGGDDGEGHSLLERAVSGGSIYGGQQVRAMTRTSVAMYIERYGLWH
jgi:hypothetical protein